MSFEMMNYTAWWHTHNITLVCFFFFLLKWSQWHCSYFLCKITDALYAFRWVNALEKDTWTVITRMSYAFPHYHWLWFTIERKKKKKRSDSFKCVPISTYPYQCCIVLFSSKRFPNVTLSISFWISDTHRTKLVI